MGSALLEIESERVEDIRVIIHWLKQMHRVCQRADARFSLIQAALHSDVTRALMLS